MIPVGTAAECRDLDRRVIDGLGLPGLVLMELASRGVAEVARQAGGPVLVVCGGGNNGGDGWGAARWLHGWGVPTRVWPVDPPRTPDAAAMAEAARRAGVAVVDGPGADDGWVVDALFGTGLTRPIVGRYAAIIDAVAGRRTLAVDLPTGLCADTGRSLGRAWPAAKTVTFGRLKRGLFAADGPRLAGKVECVDLGFGAVAGPAGAHVVEAADIRWPSRSPDDHKGRSGHLVVVAGSAAMAGAAVLCCQGALAAGAGLVTLVTARGAAPRLGQLPAAVMVVYAGEGDRVERLPPLPARATAIVVGPGLGGGEPLPAAVEDDLRRWWATEPRPVLFDADALVAATGPASGPRVLTPHSGEAARMLGVSVAAVDLDRFAAVDALAAHGTALLKGRYTLVSEGPGAAPTINPRGAATLATGGSGDVLAGAIGALLARGCPPGDAARAGAWVHGAAGERLQALGAEGWDAHHIADALGAAARALTGTG